MNYYDYTLAKEIISQHSDEIESAELGMAQDWYMTAETVWENGVYKRDIPDDANTLADAYAHKRENGAGFFETYDEYGKILIAGLCCSDWATPTLKLNFKDDLSKSVAVSRQSKLPLADIIVR